MIEMIKRALKFGNLRYKIICFLINILGYSNSEIQDLEVRNKVFKYLKKRYEKELGNQRIEKISSKETNKTVWVCWFQGYDNAPQIVKTCINSMYKWLNDYEIILIDEKNLFNYVDLPKYVIEKWNKGIISNTLFSDFIRLDILNKYGGIWVDATVLFTGPLPKYIVDSDFFMYRCNVYDVAKFGESWFIKSESHNRILKLTLQLMNKYWKKENKIKDYFQMFIFMQMVIKRYPEDVDNMINIPSSIPHMMQKYLNSTYDEKIYDSICSITNIHKLTYKNIEMNVHNTFFRHILELGE